MGTSLNKEAMTFYEFLNDEFSNDALLFYLNCRYILLGGQMMQIQASNFNVPFYK